LPNAAGGPAVDPSAQKAPPRADTTATPQLDANNQSGAPFAAQANVQATTDAVAPRSNGTATVSQADDGGSANAAPANAAAKAASGSLPSLGVAAANAATVQTAAATPGAAPAAAAAAVPIAGLPVVIAAHAQAGSSQFDIRLAPPELGRIDVRLDVDSNGQVTSHVTADRPETLTLLQSQQPQLERALAQAGLRTADNGLQFSLRDQSFSGQNSGGGNNSGGQQSTPQLVIPDSNLAPVDASQIYSRIARGGGIDIRV
jgi:flagellar hook-length control protein FliK